MTAHTPVAVTVGYDGAPCSRAALRWALVQAGHWPATVSVVTVWATEPQHRVAGTERMTSADLARIVKLRAVHLGSMSGLDPDLVVSLDTVVGHPADVLVERSRTSDLLVVGVHGRQFAGLGPAAGAVSRSCLRESYCPVVLIGERVAAVSPARIVVSAAEHQDDQGLAAWVDLLRLCVGTSTVLPLVELDEPWSTRELAARTRPDDLLVVGRASGPVPSLLLRDPGCPVLVAPNVPVVVMSGELEMSDAS